MSSHYFEYGQKELDYLKKKDKRLAEVINKLGHIQRSCIPDLFSALVNSVIGQQISTKAHETIWQRLQNEVGVVSPDAILALTDLQLQGVGLSFRKVEYIKGIAQKVYSGELDLNLLQELSDHEVCNTLTQLKGIGTWTAEMIMLFSMNRMNIVSFGDLAIVRGMRMLYHHREIDSTKFARYQKRYSPYASVASLYLWAIAGGAIEGMRDYEPKKKK